MTPPPVRMMGSGLWDVQVDGVIPLPVLGLPEAGRESLLALGFRLRPFDSLRSLRAVVSEVEPRRNRQVGG